MKKNIKILKELFWEYNWNSVKKNLHSTFIISRVLEMGRPEQYKVLQEKIGKKPIINFLNSKKLIKMLSNRSLNFWRLVLCKKH